MNDILLQKIDELSLIRQNRDLLHISCGMKLEIRRPDGSQLKSPTSKKNERSADLENRIPLKCTCSETTSNCDYINPLTLSFLQDTRQPQRYVCPSGFKKIVIPIVISDEIIGLLFTGENKSFRLSEEQSATMMDILQRSIAYIVQNELTPLNLAIYRNNNQTRPRELLNRAVKCIKNNYHSNELTLKLVSQDTGISYFYLSRIFKKELNTTFAQLRNKVRMEAAVKLLKNSHLPVTKISYTCGFDDPAYFCKVFKNTFGTSPTIFRRTHR